MFRRNKQTYTLEHPDSPSRNSKNLTNKSRNVVNSNLNLKVRGSTSKRNGPFAKTIRNLRFTITDTTILKSIKKINKDKYDIVEYFGEISDEMPNGIGEITLENNNKIRGNWIEGELITINKITYKDGIIKEGKIDKDTEILIEGKKTFMNGNVEEGDFDKDNGYLIKGTVTLISGLKIEGEEFDKDTRKLIKGKVIYNDGYVEEGVFSQDTSKLIKGKKSNKYKHGTTQEGDFDKDTGLLIKGKKTFGKGNILEEEGLWENNKFISGEQIYRNGIIRKGFRLDGKFIIHTVIYPKGLKDIDEVIEEGEFMGNMGNMGLEYQVLKNGIRTYSDGRKEEYKNGKCITLIKKKFTNKEGITYDGEFDNDNNFVKGIITFKNGQKYEGEMENGYVLDFNPKNESDNANDNANAVKSLSKTDTLFDTETKKEITYCEFADTYFKKEQHKTETCITIHVDARQNKDKLQIGLSILKNKIKDKIKHGDYDNTYLKNIEVINKFANNLNKYLSRDYSFMDEEFKNEHKRIDMIKDAILDRDESLITAHNSNLSEAKNFSKIGSIINIILIINLFFEEMPSELQSYFAQNYIVSFIEGYGQTLKTYVRHNNTIIGTRGSCFLGNFEKLLFSIGISIEQYLSCGEIIKNETGKPIFDCNKTFEYFKQINIENIKSLDKENIKKISDHIFALLPIFIENIKENIIINNFKKDDELFERFEKYIFDKWIEICNTTTMTRFKYRSLENIKKCLYERDTKISIMEMLEPYITIDSPNLTNSTVGGFKKIKHKSKKQNKTYKYSVSKKSSRTKHKSRTRN